MKVTFFLLLSFLLFSCGGDSGSSTTKTEDRKQAKILASQARIFLSEGNYDSASNYLSKAIILDMDSSRENAVLLSDIQNYNSAEFFEKTLRNLEPTDFQTILADRALDFDFLKDQGLNALFIKKIKNNRKLGLKLTQQGVKGRALAAKNTKEKPVTTSLTALDAVKKEPKVLDAYITEVGVLYVQVRDDGTKRNGYAEYLCQVLKDHHSSASRVKVVKANSQNDPDRDNAYGVLLGESWCR